LFEAWIETHDVVGGFPDIHQILDYGILSLPVREKLFLSRVSDMPDDPGNPIPHVGQAINDTQGLRRAVGHTRSASPSTV
jgi:hypothetical protein